MALEIGAVLTNDEIVQAFKVGNMGGMRRSNATNSLVIISDPFKSLYEDRWIGSVLHYTGMGKVGDQRFEGNQNKTLRDSNSSGISVHLFEVNEPLKYTYMGLVELAGEVYEEIQPDENGDKRKVLMFPLTLKDKGNTLISQSEFDRKRALLASRLAKMKPRDIERSAMLVSGRPGSRTVTSSQYERNPYVSEYVKQVASGHCQFCGNPAPFADKFGKPYLEAHHVVWLSRGGDDTVDNTVALCPNCHRKVHVLDRKQDIEVLTKVANGNATRGVQ